MGHVSLRTERGGFTLAEVVMASVLGAVVAGGTMMAYVTAARISARPTDLRNAEAANYAQATIESIRNAVAADSTWLASSGSTWYEDPLPAPAAGGSESLLQVPHKRCYRITQEDCNGEAGGEECYAIQVKVCWNELDECPVVCTPRAKP